MALTKASVAVLAPTSGAAASTKAAPGVVGPWIDCNTYHAGSVLGYSIANGANAPGVAGTLLFQMSPDNGVTVFDYYLVGGDSAVSSVTSGAIGLDRGVKYIRAIGYGNTTNPVTFAANLQAVTAL